MFNSDLGRTPSNTRHLIRYGEPRPKVWAKPLGLWSRDNSSTGMARQLYENVEEPFVPEVKHPFDNGLGEVKDFWQIAREAAAGAAELFKAREARKTAEAQARIPIVPMLAKSTFEYWPWILGGGAVVLLGILATRR